MLHSFEQPFKERKAKKDREKNLRLFPCILDVSEHRVASRCWFLILVQDKLMFRIVPHAVSKVRRMMKQYRAFKTKKKKKDNLLLTKKLLYSTNIQLSQKSLLNNYMNKLITTS